MTKQNKNKLVFHDPISRQRGYSEVLSHPDAESAEFKRATLHHTESGPEVRPKAGSDIGSTALYAAYVAVDSAKDVLVMIDGANGPEDIVLSGRRPTRAEVKAIPKETQQDIKQRFESIEGTGRLSRRKKIAIGARAMAATDEYFSDSTS